MTVHMPQGTKGRWYLVRSKPRQETAAQAQLERQGFLVYLPRTLRTVRIRGRWLDRVESLFPRYLFLKADVESQSLAPVRSTVGVADVVRFGGEYATVPDGIVDRLMTNVDPESGLHRLRESSFKRGAQVRVLEGPLEQLEGVFECYDGTDRVVILLEVLGRMTRVHMPLAQVIPELAY